MKIISWFVSLVAVFVMAMAAEAQVGAAAAQKNGAVEDAVAAVRQRLVESLGSVREAYDDTHDSKPILRRHLWQVGRALPWRGMLEPSCGRRGEREIWQSLEAWPAVTDAPALRSLLADSDSAIRALAAEALATLHQPEDLPRLVALVTDPADALMDLAPPMVQQCNNPPVIAGPGPDAVTRYRWQPSCVAHHAAWGLYVMLGECFPSDLNFRLVDVSEDPQFLRDKRALAKLDPKTQATLAAITAGDPKDHVWYWQEYIHRSVHQLNNTADNFGRLNLSDVHAVERNRRARILHDERRKAKQAWMKNFFAEMRAWPAERRAMVRLLVCDVQPAEAGIAYYDPHNELIFSGPLELGLEKKRILELLDGVGVWSTERHDRNAQNQVVERLAMGWRESFDATDVPRLFKALQSGGNLGSSARAALLVALVNLMPMAGVASDDLATAEGFARQVLKDDRSEYVRIRAAQELLRMDLDMHWPLVKERFFADWKKGDSLPISMFEWFRRAPGDGPTRKLLDLMKDDRFGALWLEVEERTGKGGPGKGIREGKYSRYAQLVLNTRVGREVVSNQDVTAPKDPELGPARLQLILARVQEIGKP